MNAAKKLYIRKPYEQDVFDKAFIKILYEVQSRGFCKNLKKLEEYLGIPFNTLYQVKMGNRGVPLTYRDKVIQLFSNKYDVNPKSFNSLIEPIFKHDPPDFENVMEDFDSPKIQLTSGTVAELQRLRVENKAFEERVKSLESALKAKDSELRTLKRLLELLDKK